MSRDIHGPLMPQASPLAPRRVGVLLLTFGTADTIADVPAYLAHVRGGSAPSDLVAEFQRRLERIGGSPLTRITREQAGCLQRHLNESADRISYWVRAGMLHAPPFIRDVVCEVVAEKPERIVAIVLSPQYSPLVMRRYLDALREAETASGLSSPIRVAGAWHLAPPLIEGLAQQLTEALASLDPDERDRAPVLFTAHSLPRSVADAEPGYLQQLRETALAVAQAASLDASRWQFAYQSAGHTREEWLRPDLVDVFPELAAQGHKEVVVAPVQFVADHLEVLYDIDVAAREQAAATGLLLVRTESLNTHPLFIEALASVVHRELGLATGTVESAEVGTIMGSQ